MDLNLKETKINKFNTIITINWLTCCLKKSNNRGRFYLKKLLEKAGKTIVETCSQLKPKEVVSIITDKDSIDIGMLIKRHASEISTNIHFHILDDYGERPLKSFPKEIRGDLKNSDVTYYTAQAKKGEYLIGKMIMLATRTGREIS